MTTYANVGHVLLKRGNTTQSAGYTGPLGELTYDTDLGTVRVHNNVVAGGVNILATQAQVNLINANLASAVSTIGNSISTITGIDAIFVANINTLLANAAVQSLAIGNLQAFQTYANATFGTSNYGNANVASYLISNPQGSTYSNANVSSYLSTQTFYSNTNAEAYFGANIGSLWANVGVQSANIATLVANAATQSSAITTLQGQVGQTYGNANVAAYLPSYTGNVSSGNLTVNSRSIKPTYTVQYLAVGGGGGGGAGYWLGGMWGSIPGGSGGAGGVLTGTTQFTSGLTYNIVVGTGGTGGVWGTNNGNATSGNVTYISEPTTLANIIAYSGGYGGGAGQNGGNGSSGGGGGAGLSPNGTGDVVTSGGSANNYFVSSAYTTQGTAGGTGNKTADAGGGGGVNVSLSIGNVTATFGTGASVSRSYSGSGTNATANSGNGGGAGGQSSGSNNQIGGNGGSGVVYITYCSPTQLGTGGTVWSYTQNGYTYWMHQFTSSGTYVA